MKAVIMAGGEGTRLRPLTCDLPKPLAKLCGKANIRYILELLSKHGCTQAALTLRYKGKLIEQEFIDGRFGEIKLNFCYEEKPLGTAGCVKPAAADFDEPFVVVSGDAMCDFDLTAALKFHAENKAAATIITKCVADPREYGLVIAEKGVVTGFSEKPSYLGCTSELANTGVYIISPQVLKIIPDGKQSDFARDIFPEMLKRGMKLCSYEERGYWCDIGDLESYIRCQGDMLRGEVGCRLEGERRGYGIICGSELTNVRIKPHSWLGENVTVGENSVIDGCVIGSNVTIGSDCRLHGAIILDGVFIGDNVTCNGCVICPASRICGGAEVFELAVIGENCLIGENACVKPGVRIWQEKTIAAGMSVSEDVKYGGSNRIEQDENGFYGGTNSEITPEYTVRLGSAAACVARRGIAVASAGGNAAAALKAAFIAGASASGCGIFDCGDSCLSLLIYNSRLLEADLTVHITSDKHTEIAMLNRFGLPLTRAQERKLEGGINRGEFNRAEFFRFGAITVTSGLDAVYRSVIENLCTFKSKYSLTIACPDEGLRRIAVTAAEKISAGGSDNAEHVTAALDRTGTKVQLITGDGMRITHSSLLLLASAFTMKKGIDAALPYDFSSRADYVAQSYGRKVLRFFASSNGSGDEEARTAAAAQPYLFDGLFLLLEVLRGVEANKTTLEQAIKALPRGETEKRFVPIDCPPQRVLSRLSTDKRSGGEGIIVSDADKGRVHIRSGRRGDGLYITAESTDTETAAELCDSVERIVRRLTDSGLQQNKH